MINRQERRNLTVKRLEILEHRPYADGRVFGDVGAYDRIDAIAHYAVKPDHQANHPVVDIACAPRDGDGLVRFSGDLTLLVPADPSRANRALLMQVPNRGRRMITNFNIGPSSIEPTNRIEPGDGFLFERGWTVAWAGWQWDVPRTPKGLRAGLTAPQVDTRWRAQDEAMQLRFQLNEDKTRIRLTDQHVGDLGRHQAIAPRAPDDPADVLVERDTIYGAARTIAREKWRFVKSDDSKAENSNAIVLDSVELDGCFKAGRIYDVIYHPRDCPVAGSGLLAIRDMARYLRRDDGAPTAGMIDHVIGEGVSQCGRLWRTFLHAGLNCCEDGQPAVDGVLAHIAGARRGEFNHRYAQPSVQPTPSVGHLFPFADVPQTDPLSGRTAGLLDRQRANGCMPRVMFTNSSAEYWRGDAALAHTDLETGNDSEPSSDVRYYLFASTQHSPGAAALSDTSMFGSRGRNFINVIDQRPLHRNCLLNLLDWVADGKAPPPSEIPRADDGTRQTRHNVLAHLAAIPNLALPGEAGLTVMRALDLGERVAEGIVCLPAIAKDATYPDWVSAVDTDGNEIAGVAMPDVTVPLATHLGFNPRHPDTGAADQPMDYFGSSHPFALTEPDRVKRGDPRPSIAERYESRDHYLSLVKEAAATLVKHGHLRREDIDVCCRIAEARWDEIVGEIRAPRKIVPHLASGTQI